MTELVRGQVSNNPQHRRALTNELISSVFLSYLKITVPETSVIQLTPAFLAGNPDL